MLFMLPAVLIAAEPTEEELERWLESDEPLPYKDYSSGPTLKFIPPVTDKVVPHSYTRLSISPDSLRNGWVTLEQCHRNLDPVPSAEVVYRFRTMRGLAVTESHHIESTMVEGQSVQLHNVEHGAILCVAAEVELIRQQGERHHLRYGPFQRKFLDSYFPFHVTLELSLPDGVTLDAISPTPEQGYELVRAPGRMVADAWFSGELTFQIRLKLEE